MPACEQVNLGTHTGGLAAALAVGAVATLHASGEVDFERDIRPILAEKCALCHGPDEQKGGLQLTGLALARKQLKSGKVAIVPGEVESSALIERIHSRDPDEVMPPPGKAAPLTDSEKDLLARWIASGAEWPGHWAYAPLKQPVAPVVKQAGWVSSPIDAFVLADLEEAMISPSPPADPTTLIRRLFYDLIGLPPTLDQLSRYQQALQSDPEAGLSRLVDELLASKHFGERWGRHWLDKARYADSDGYEKDNNRPDAWRYRDWVIDAINRDLPLDRFTIEQFAGDLLDDANPNQLLATAFNRQTLTNTEGGTDREQWRVAAVMDRVETMGSVWMGLTLTCARCHTHKYDLITQREYYQLFAYFNNGDESNGKVPRSNREWSDYLEARANYEESFAGLEAELTRHRKDLEVRLPEWEREIQDIIARTTNSKGPEIAPVITGKTTGPEGVTFTAQSDGSVLVGGENPDKATYTITGLLPPGPVTGLRLEVLPDESFAAKGPGRADNGNFVLSNIELTTGGKSLSFSGAQATHSQNAWPVTDALDDPGEDSGWGIAREFGKPHHAHFALNVPLKNKQATPFTLVMDQNHGKKHTIGRFRVAAITSPTLIGYPAEIRSILAKPADQRSSGERNRLLAQLEKLDPRTKPLAARLESARRKGPKPPQMDARILRERGKDRRTTHILHRGEFKQPADAVQPGTLSTLPPIAHREGSPGDRLDLARWLVNGKNPLPPRVLANQVWTHLFGEGLVTTLNDFGVRGARPSNRRLLDWVAAELIRNGWSRKKLIKTIALSSTYRQSSNHRPELRETDPKNRLLGRQNRFRVEAEIVRDISLHAAGLLASDVGGVSVFPPLPSGVKELNYNSAFRWKVSEGRNKYRRGIYTYFKRTAPHPNLMTFDCPDSNVTCVQRTRSNTPLAALITLNNATFTEAARSLASRVLKADDLRDDRGRITRAFQLCLSRAPHDTELGKLLQLLRTSRSWYASHPKEAGQMVPGEIPAGITKVECASYAATVRVILNLDEFLTRN